MKIRYKILINNIGIGVIPILAGFLIIILVLSLSSEYYAYEAMVKDISSFKILLNSDIQKYADFSYFLSREIPANIDFKRKTIGNYDTKLSVNRYNVRLYEVYLEDKLLHREMYSWKDNVYFTSQESASKIWIYLKNPSISKNLKYFYQDIVSNVLVLRSCSILFDEKNQNKIGFSSIITPLDADYFAQLPLLDENKSYFIHTECGYFFSREDLNKPENYLALKNLSNQIQNKRQFHFQNDPNKYYCYQENLFSSIESVNKKKIRKNLADIGILYNQSEFNNFTKILLRTSSIWFFICLLISIFAGIILSNFLTNPIKNLLKQIKDFQKDKKPIPFPDKSQDELSELQQGLGEMAQDIIDNDIIQRSFLQTQVELNNKLIYSSIELDKEKKLIRERNQTLENDLILARRIQNHFIPSESPTNYIDFYYKPMEKVGGDFFEFVQFRNSELIGIFLSDVSGHGVAAAFITAMIKSNLLQNAPYINKPSFILRLLNQYLIQLSGGNFITAFYGIYNPVTNVFIYSNAGHNPPYIIGKTLNEIPFENDTGLPLAVVDNDVMKSMGKDFKDYQITLEKNTKLLLFTDGLLEAINQFDKSNTPVDFEHSGLINRLIENIEMNSRDFINSLIKDLLEFHGSDSFEDDVCVICLDVK